MYLNVFVNSFMCAFLIFFKISAFLQYSRGIQNINFGIIADYDTRYSRTYTANDFVTYSPRHIGDIIGSYQLITVSADKSGIAADRDILYIGNVHTYPARYRGFFAVYEHIALV